MPGLKLSIALWTYNGERFLQRQLDSLLSQMRFAGQIEVGDGPAAVAASAGNTGRSQGGNYYRYGTGMRSMLRDLLRRD